jgi:alpha-beta hydrolase superfamily lysophospholipase
MSRLSLIVALVAGCANPELGIFLPTKTSAYALPGNRIPAALLREGVLESAGGERLAVVSARHGGGASPAVVALLHGQGGNIDDAWERVMRLWDLGFDVSVVDYRGFGKSSGSPSEAGLYLDAAALYASLIAEAPDVPVVIWGHSLGTGVASHLGVDTPGACALVLESPFTSLTDMVERSSPLGVPADWVTDARFDTLGRIAELKLPLVIAHGTDDARVPFWMGETVYTHAPEPKRFVAAPGARHDDVLAHAGAAVAAALREIAPCAGP